MGNTLDGNLRTGVCMVLDICVVYVVWLVVTCKGGSKGLMLWAIDYRLGEVHGVELPGRGCGHE